MNKSIAIILAAARRISPQELAELEVARKGPCFPSKPSDLMKDEDLIALLADNLKKKPKNPGDKNP